jgi:site-specific recombinase XerD
MDALDRFAREYQELHKMSRERRVSQLRELGSFAEFAGKPIEQCNSEDFSAYLGMLSGGRLHVNTVAKRANMLRPFFKWGFTVRLIDADTLMRVKAVQNPRDASSRGVPRPYSQKEMQGLWLALDRRWPKADKKWWSRWGRGTSRYARISSHVCRAQTTAIIRLALDCGLRREEIYNLTVDDLHPDNAGVAVLKGKGGKPRQVPLTNEARWAVAEWLRIRRLFGPRHNRVWLTVMGNQPWQGKRKAGEKHAARAVRSPVSFTGFCKTLSHIGPYELHRLRHTCATNWLRAGVTIQTVQKHLGHATIQQTLLYTQILEQDIQVEIESHEEAFEAMSGRAA